ncbi:Isopenicillin N epimerase [Luteitalea pratensis]|uniref:Isopenicillin N epimerase n=1 Tax=Luteitalea pratensis TaxID=1855912 RepID=A0A143PIK3_LUTPR|nr:aminotransferase class V-fold PLP-dependent enzyme [Luteitalea pratensis]AMY07918.1 Isopenicillin N epimerase [Luteitalea pratensis]
MHSGWSRRAFLRVPVAGAAALSAVDVQTAFAREMKAPQAWKFDAGYWDRVRRNFHLQEGLAYLNTGTVGATPAPVLAAMNRYWQLMAENPNENSAVLQGRQEAIRAKAAAFIGADAAEVAILRNASEGNSLVCQGIDLAKGDEVLIGSLEHDSNRQPWLLRAKRAGIVVKEVPIGTPAESPQAIVDAFERAITGRTKVISVAHCDTVTGTITPLKQIAALAHSRGLLIFADGAQMLGATRVDVRDLDVDTYTTTCHKWLASPAGTGLLYIRKGLQDRIWPSVATENWWSYSDARKYDRVSRRPWPVVAALEHALDFQAAIGQVRIEQRIRELSQHFRREAARIPHVVLYTPQDPTMSAGITSLTLDNVAPDLAREYLRLHHDVYIAARTKGERYPADPNGVTGFRVSTHFYNTFEEVERVLTGLRALASGTAS